MSRAAPELEVTVDSPGGARAARDGGADRVELCSALELGGLTPSAGALGACLSEEGALPVHVLVRPRPGGFTYDAEELRTSLRDVEAAVAAGAAGVVVGALRARDGALSLDEAFLAEAVQRARAVRTDVEVVVHRAVDQLAAPSRVVAVLAELGVDRVLTSGGAPRAVEGIAELTAVAAAGRQSGVEVMAGAGVRPEQVPALVEAGVHAVHLSARRPVRAAGPRVAVGPADDGVHSETDPALVAAVRAALDALPLRDQGRSCSQLP
ncbi:MAG: copper homeostasis protein CutC [Quadrisphaera sp.]